MVVYLMLGIVGGFGFVCCRCFMLMTFLIPKKKWFLPVALFSKCTHPRSHSYSNRLECEKKKNVSVILNFISINSTKKVASIEVKVA